MPDYTADQESAGHEPSSISAGDTAGGTATAVPTQKPGSPSRNPKQLPPYKVLLHNDDVNSFDYVIQTVLKLTALSREDAVLRTLEAHESGVALLLVTHRERAELYAEQFTSCKISVTLEPADG